MLSVLLYEISKLSAKYNNIYMVSTLPTTLCSITRVSIEKMQNIQLGKIEGNFANPEDSEYGLKSKSLNDFFSYAVCSKLFNKLALKFIVLGL